MSFERLVFITIVFGVFLGLDLLWWWRAERATTTLTHGRRWGAAVRVWAGLQIGILLTVLVGRFVAPWLTIPSWLLSSVFLWHLLVLPAWFVFWAVGGSAHGVVRLLSRWTRGRPDVPAGADVPVPRAVPIGRRAFLATAVAVPPALTILGSGVGAVQVRSFRVRALDIPLSTLPASLDGMTIAHLSDTHVGDFTRGRVLRQVVEATNDLDADLVVVTGDLINRSLSDLPVAAELIGALRGRSGVFACEGNHDLFQGRRAFETEAVRLGIPILIDQSRVVTVRGTPVEVLGLRWGEYDPEDDDDHRYRVRGRDLSNAILRLDARRVARNEAFPILLAHHPHAFDQAAEAGIPLTLAGHTHGGQLHLTHEIGFGPLLFKYWSGLYRKPNGAACVVSNGTGNWFPLRIGKPAEILHLTLRRA